MDIFNTHKIYTKPIKAIIIKIHGEFIMGEENWGGGFSSILEKKTMIKQI